MASPLPSARSGGGEGVQLAQQAEDLLNDLQNDIKGQLA